LWAEGAHRWARHQNVGVPDNVEGKESKPKRSGTLKRRGEKDSAQKTT